MTTAPPKPNIPGHTEIVNADGTSCWWPDDNLPQYPSEVQIPVGRSVRYDLREISPDYHETDLLGVPRYVSIMGQSYFLREIRPGAVKLSPYTGEPMTPELFAIYRYGTTDDDNV